MKSVHTDLTAYINSDISKYLLEAVHAFKEPESLSYENAGDRGGIYLYTPTPFTSSCTQCPSPVCCFASYSTGSIIGGSCITQEIADLVKYH